MRRYVVEVDGLPDDVADVDVRAALAVAVSRLTSRAVAVGTSGGRDDPAAGFYAGRSAEGHLSLAPPAAPPAPGPLSQGAG
jgi:hypothetical protein